MVLGSLADGLLDGAGALADRASGWLEPTLRLGVTGLSRSGKTVFVTALIASLLRRGRLAGLVPEAEGRIIAAMIGRQPDPAVPRFPFERNLSALTGAEPRWPEPTRSVSQIRLSLRYRPTGFAAALSGRSTLHLDIVDYPGEWLADIPLMEQDYADWAAAALAEAETPRRAPHAAGWRAALAAADPAARHGEPAAEALAAAWAGYLRAGRDAGLSALSPGRLLMPGDLEGSPALTFAPLPRPDRPPRDSLWAEMARRFEDYKRVVARPFFRDHFAGIDRQVVLVDTLGALARGPAAMGDLIEGMTATLGAFRHGRPWWFDRLLGGRRIDRLLFAATKADHLHSEQHANLAALTEAMLSEASARAAYRGAETRAMAIAAIRATAEQEATRGGERLALVRGRNAETGREVAVFPGRLPENPRPLIAAATGGEMADWPEDRFETVPFAPPDWGGRPENGPPHIRLDKALDFLVGDRLE